MVNKTFDVESLSPRSKTTSPNEEPPKGSIAWPFGGNCFIVSFLSIFRARTDGLALHLEKLN
jgi:hypothetical protein